MHFKWRQEETLTVGKGGKTSATDRNMPAVSMTQYVCVLRGLISTTAAK